MRIIAESNYSGDWTEGVRKGERRIRERVELHDNQFGFRPGRGTKEAVFIMR